MGLKLKEESIVAHLIYNYLATIQIIDPVAHLLSEEFIQEVEDRNLYLLERIEEMMQIMRENDSLEQRGRQSLAIYELNYKRRF